MALRLAFFGTPDFAVPSLLRLQASSHLVVAVVTQPDRPRGRGHKLAPSPVKARALATGVPVFQPDRLKDDAFLAAFAELHVDLAIVAAYGKILPKTLLDLPRLGMINVHASLLPRWRGAAPIHRAVLAGDAKTGVTIMRVVTALDAGPMLATVELAIGPNETTAELEPRVAAAGADLLIAIVNRLEAGPIEETPQDETRVTYAARLERSESRIDWNRPAAAIHNQIRGLQPWPLAAAMLQGRRVLLTRSELDTTHTQGTDVGRVFRPGEPIADVPPGTIVEVDADALVVSCAPGLLRIVSIQPEGRAAMSVRDFLNGRHVTAGERFEPLPAA
jgi:methionyl-tRNA formyltransferase